LAFVHIAEIYSCVFTISLVNKKLLLSTTHYYYLSERKCSTPVWKVSRILTCYDVCPWSSS